MHLSRSGRDSLWRVPIMWGAVSACACDSAVLPDTPFTVFLFVFSPQGGSALGWVLFISCLSFIIFPSASFVLLCCVPCDFWRWSFITLSSSVSRLLLPVSDVVFILPVAPVHHSSLSVYVCEQPFQIVLFISHFLRKPLLLVVKTGKTTLFLRRGVKPIAEQLIAKYIL